MPLSLRPTTTVLPISEAERARTFYADTLGLAFIRKSADGDQIFALNGSSALALIEKPPGVQAEHTTLRFEVEDIAKMMALLERRGVIFEDYDLPGLRTVAQLYVRGSEKTAWFKDPDGNVLSLHEQSIED